jgi:hypothetical protein
VRVVVLRSMVVEPAPGAGVTTVELPADGAVVVVVVVVVLLVSSVPQAETARATPKARAMPVKVRAIIVFPLSR